MFVALLAKRKNTFYNIKQAYTHNYFQSALF